MRQQYTEDFRNKKTEKKQIQSEFKKKSVSELLAKLKEEYEKRLEFILKNEMDS